MLVRLQGNLRNVTRNEDGTVTVTLKLAGNVDNRSGEAKKATMEATLILKQLVADELKLGSVISVILGEGFLTENMD